MWLYDGGFRGVGFQVLGLRCYKDSWLRVLYVQLFWVSRFLDLELWRFKMSGLRV